MAEGERATGTPNTIYNLSSVLFHALEGGANYDQYIQDAEREGDQELVEFFQLVRDEDSNRADRAQQLLAERTTIAERTGGMVAGTPPAAGQDLPRRGDPLGREDRLPEEERAALGREDPLPREERAALGREDPLPREERARETEREEDKGRIDRALDKLSGRGEEERRER